MQKISIKSVEDLESELINFNTLFAYHSNKIENDEISYHHTRDVFEDGEVRSFTGSPKTLFMIQNQLDCYHFLKEKIVAKEPITKELIKEMHFELTKGTYDYKRYFINKERPGEFKKHDYIVGKSEVGCYPEDVEEEIDSLLQEIEDNKDANPLTVGCYLHAMFENIHPFADGNGRVGRTLLNYYLLINDVAPIVIYENDRERYYKCLEAFDEHEDLTALMQFVEYSQKKTWQKDRTQSRRAGLDSLLKTIHLEKANEPMIFSEHDNGRDSGRNFELS